MDLKNRSAFFLTGENRRSVSLSVLCIIFLILRNFALIQVESFTSDKRRLMINLFSGMVDAVLFLNKKESEKKN